MSEESGYIRTLNTGVVAATQTMFGPDYPDPRLQSLHVSIEYPIKEQEYPSIWVTYDDTALRNAGIGHYEVIDDGTYVLRWYFEGVVSWTVVAFTALERDRIYDEVVKNIAFNRIISSGSDDVSSFRKMVETNPFIAMNFNFDEIEPQGANAAPGTPWQSDEIIYERTLGLEVRGEFTVDLNTGDLVPLSKIQIQGRLDGSTEQEPQGELDWNITTNLDPNAIGPWI